MVHFILTKKRSFWTLKSIIATRYVVFASSIPQRRMKRHEDKNNWKNENLLRKFFFCVRGPTPPWRCLGFKVFGGGPHSTLEVLVFKGCGGIPELNRSNTSLLDLYHLRGGGGGGGGGHQTDDIWPFMEEVETLKFSGGSGKLNFQEEVVNLVN